MRLPTLTQNKRELRTGLSLVLYSAGSVHEIAPAVAGVIESYLQFVPPRTLRNHFTNDASGDGTYAALTEKVVERDLKTLRALPRKKKAFTLDYVQGSGTGPGTHSVFFEGTRLEKPRGSEDETNLLRLDVPSDVLRSPGLDAFLDFIIRISSMFPFQTGNCGLCLQRLAMGNDDVDEAVLSFLPRYAGFEFSSSSLRYDMGGHTFGAHWIELLDPALAKKLGGLKAIRKALPKAEVRELPNGVFIRGAKLPPVGDLRNGAADVGLLPDVARLLLPTRLELDELEFTGDFDAAEWLARYDGMKSRAWDNG